MSAAVEGLRREGFVPVVVGGGHNNAYGVLAGCATALGGRAIGCVNVDLHADLRPAEGRHSGNPFTYALERGHLGRYAVVGMSEAYATQAIVEKVAGDPRIQAITLESMLRSGTPPQQAALAAAAHVGAGPATVERTGTPDTVWLTAESLGDDDPALAAHPALPVVFVFDHPLLTRLRLSAKRLVFLVDRLAELATERTVEVHVGDPGTVLAGRAAWAARSRVMVVPVAMAVLAVLAVVGSTASMVLWAALPVGVMALVVMARPAVAVAMVAMVVLAVWVASRRMAVPGRMVLVESVVLAAMPGWPVTAEMAPMAPLRMSMVVPVGVVATVR